MRKSIILAAAAVSVAVAAISLVPSPGRAFNVCQQEGNCPPPGSTGTGSKTNTTSSNQTNATNTTNAATNTTNSVTGSSTTTPTAAQMQAEIVQLQQQVAALQAQIGQGQTVRAANSAKSNAPINAPAGGAGANTAGLTNSAWGN